MPLQNKDFDPVSFLEKGQKTINRGRTILVVFSLVNTLFLIANLYMIVFLFGNDKMKEEREKTSIIFEAKPQEQKIDKIKIKPIFKTDNESEKTSPKVSEIVSDSIETQKDQEKSTKDFLWKVN